MALATVVLVVAAAMIIVRLVPRSPVADAAADLADWPGVTYRGVLTDPVGETTAVALTVTEDGPAYGVLEGRSGAKAQVVFDGERTRTNGNRAWWRSVGAPEVLADSWIDDPAGQPALLVSGVALAPSSVARQLTDDGVGPWEPAGDRTIGTHRGTVLSAPPEHEIVISADDRVTALWLSLPLGAPPEDGSADQVVEVSDDAALAVTRPTDRELERLQAFTTAVMSESDRGPGDGPAAAGDGERACPAAQAQC